MCDSRAVTATPGRPALRVACATMTTLQPAAVPGAAEPVSSRGMAQPSRKLVYAFGEGSRSMADLLGGKGANLAEMTSLGLPVPPGFTVTTQACRDYLRTRELPLGLMDEVTEHLASLEAVRGKRLTRRTRSWSACAAGHATRCPG